MKARLGPAFPRVTDVTRILILLTAIIVLFLGGCGKKKKSKAELREVTSEIVTAAQKISGRKSEVTIRPELLLSKNGTPGKLGSDNVYLSLSDASQAGAIAKALDEIARRHELSVRETTSDGILRFDYVTGGIRTHKIHVVIPLTARSNVAMTRGRRDARLAIIIDDLGYDREAADSLLAFGFPLTVSVLPHLPLSTEVAEEAYRRGDQVMLHLPMQSVNATAKTE